MISLVFVQDLVLKRLEKIPNRNGLRNQELSWRNINEVMARRKIELFRTKFFWKSISYL